MTWGLIADSSCNLRSFVPRAKDVEYCFAPLKINVDGIEYVDDAQLDVAELNARVASSALKSSSSCPNAGEWAELFRRFDACIVVTISANLSASYEAAVMARDMVLAEFPEKKIHLVNSRAAGGKLELIVTMVDEFMASGEHTFEEVCTYADKLEQSSQVLFSLSRYENLAKAGRMPKLAGALATRLSIRILGIASDEGTIKIVGPTRGDRKTYAKIVDSMEAQGYHGGKVFLDHVANEEAANAIADAIRNRWATADIAIVPCGGLCSYYAEEDGVIIGFEWM